MGLLLTDSGFTIAKQHVLIRGEFYQRHLLERKMPSCLMVSGRG
jgi:hypothetical protein